MIDFARLARELEDRIVGGEPSYTKAIKIIEAALRDVAAEVRKEAAEKVRSMRMHFYTGKHREECAQAVARGEGER